MALTRQQEHFVVMTVIYNELSDFTLGDGKEFRDARELISSLCECPYSEVSDYVKKTVAYALNNYGAIKDVFIPKLNIFVCTSGFKIRWITIKERFC